MHCVLWSAAPRLPIEAFANREARNECIMSASQSRPLPKVTIRLPLGSFLQAPKGTKQPTRITYHLVLSVSSVIMSSLPLTRPAVVYLKALLNVQLYTVSYNVCSISWTYLHNLKRKTR